MEYQEFCRYIEENLPYFIDDGAKIKIENQIKNNLIERKGVTFYRPDTQINPRIFLEAYYEEYMSGGGLDEICEQIAEIYKKVRLDQGIKTDFIEKIQDYNNVKERVICSLVGIRKNIGRLEQMPYTQVDDLAVIYHILLENNEQGTASISISNAMMKWWNIPVEELHADAIANSVRIFPVDMKDMVDILEDMSREYRESHREEMYVLSNTTRNRGAVVIMYPDVLKKVKEEIGDYYMVPSSIGEWLIVPKTGITSEEEFGRFIRKVNESSVVPEERLSDHLYEYDTEKNMVRTVESSLEYSVRHTMNNISPKL